MSRKKMREYICRGTLTLEGVAFTIHATSDDEAREKARTGAWSDWDIAGAASQDWELNPNTIELNE